MYACCRRETKQKIIKIVLCERFSHDQPSRLVCWLYSTYTFVHGNKFGTTTTIFRHLFAACWSTSLQFSCLFRLQSPAGLIYQRTPLGRQTNNFLKLEKASLLAAVMALKRKATGTSLVRATESMETGTNRYQNVEVSHYANKICYAVSKTLQSKFCSITTTLVDGVKAA